MRRLLDARDPGRVQAQARLERDAAPRFASTGIRHTDYGALGCGRFEVGDSISGHRPEATCVECRANLVREGGMTPAMFYGPVVARARREPDGEVG